MKKTNGYYTYLLSSLPMLHFGAKTPFSFEKFLKMCEGVVSENDIEIIKTCEKADNPRSGGLPDAMREWRAFDTALRNALVRIRAARKHKNPDSYLRADKYQDPAIANLAMNAYKNPSILESEKILDKERWKALDELESGHHFDLDALIIYVHKLLILRKYEKADAADKNRVFEKVT